MTEERMKKTVTAAVVAGTLLAVFLVLVLAYQLITITVQNNRTKKLEQEIARYDKNLSTAQGQLEYYESDLGKSNAAYRAGYHLPNE